MREPREFMRKILDKNPPGSVDKSTHMVLMKRSKLASVRVQKWIPNDPRNERTCAHMWRKMGSGGPWGKVPKQKIAEHQRASR